MPSSITLTVSHLPTSASFFLSALQPLNYVYRGRSGETIGFGPKFPPNTPPDFWITQEIPGVPAGAAHVAFPATSRTAVQDFFVAALNAGGKIHGEPCVRDQSGYYSGAVIDFDGNSIEAVYRPGFGDEDKENDVRSMMSKKGKVPSVVSRVPTEAKRNVSSDRSIAPSQAPSATLQKTQRQPTGDVLENLLNEARSAAAVARDLVNHVRPNLNSSQSTPSSKTEQSNGTGDAIVGTLLGVAAGAALTYAFTNRKNSDEDETSQPRPRRPSVLGRSATDPQHDHLSRYRAIEAPPSTYSRSSSDGKYITMHDHDYKPPVRPTSRRQHSIDSGIGLGSHSTSTSSPRRSGMKLLEGPPPTSYRSPTVLTAADRQSQSQPQSRSRSRAPSISRSQSHRNRSASASRLSRRGGDEDRKSAHTVFHMTEEVRRVSTLPAPSNVSGKSKATSVRPENYPLPPSRASTWVAGGGGGASEARSTSKSSPRSVTVRDRDRDGESGLSRSVVGKVRDVQKLVLPRGELSPSDSVSQVGSVAGRGSETRSRRG